jgi:hypothetical protein
VSGEQLRKRGGEICCNGEALLVDSYAGEDVQNAMLSGAGNETG